MKVQGIRVGDGFRPFGIRIIFESYGEANSWLKHVLVPNLDVVGVRAVIDKMAERMDSLDDEEVEL